MTLVLKSNVYQGINAHLHSVLQAEQGGWKVFHNAHIPDIAKDIDSQLPDGYEVSITKSLQIREFHPDSGERLRRTEPDVTIYELNAAQTVQKMQSAQIQPTITMPALQTLEEEDVLYLDAVLISRIEEENRIPVTRIELLSPTNKPPEIGFVQYREKRAITLRDEIPLIEIDYLHETQSPIRGVPNYSQFQQGAFPYYISVTDPRPSLERSMTNIYAFGVDEVIKTIPIPLNNEDILLFDFNSSYQSTFASLSYFRNRANYADLPIHFERYAPDDQTRILEVMERAKNLST